MSNLKYTGRKFYNKWVYKVTLDLKGCSIFRTHSLDQIKQIFKDSDLDSISRYYIKSAFLNSKNIIDVGDFLEQHKSVEFAKRIESNLLDVYTNDQNFYNNLWQTFNDLLIHRFEPIPGHEKDIEETTGIITTKLPHNKYNYKVYLLPHKLKNDKDGKQSFINWVSSQPRIRISEAVKRWFIKTDWNWDRRYILVEDEKTLFMMKLRNSEVIGRVYNYQLVDK